MKFLLTASAAGAALAMTPVIAQPAPTAPAKRAAAAQTRADLQTRAQRLFARLDANRDGFVTQAEADAVRARRVVKKQERASQRAQRRDPAVMFERLDTNKDGQITRVEADAVRAARSARKGGQPAAAHAATAGRLFERADSNRDGKLTRAELAALPRSEHKGRKAGTPRPGGGKLFAAGDANKDGRLSLAEVQQLSLQRFDRVDVNRDGTVTREERKQARQQARAQRRSS